MTNTETVAGKHCKLLEPTRDASGKFHKPEEELIIKRIVSNLDRVMYLVECIDGTSAFFFPSEVSITD